MKKTKENHHTPGPWTRESRGLGDGYDIQAKKGRYLHKVAIVENDGIEMDESLANARLIAAAPDLLEALKTVHERRIAWPAEIESMVVTAIARAEGDE